MSTIPARLGGPESPTEIRGFQDHLKEFADDKVDVIGVSTDSFFSHEAWFADRDVLPYTLIYKAGERIAEFAGGGIGRLESRLERREVRSRLTVSEGSAPATPAGGRGRGSS